METRNGKYDGNDFNIKIASKNPYGWVIKSEDRNRRNDDRKESRTILESNTKGILERDDTASSG